MLETDKLMRLGLSLLDFRWGWGVGGGRSKPDFLLGERETQPDFLLGERETQPDFLFGERETQPDFLLGERKTQPDFLLRLCLPLWCQETHSMTFIPKEVLR